MSWRQLCLLLLVVSTSCSAAPLSYDDFLLLFASEQISVNSLGQPVQLGMLYDSVTNTFLDGVSLWTKESIAKGRQVSTSPNNVVEFTNDDSYIEKRKRFDLQADVSAKISIGFFSLKMSGSAQYINDFRTTTNQARVVVNYLSRSGSETLSMELLSKPEFPQIAVDTLTTHVVTGVLYGADALFVFDKLTTSSDEKKVQEASLSASFDYFLGDVTASAKVNITNEEIKNAKSFSCKFYGDVLPDQTPVNLDTAIEVCKNLPATIRRSGIVKDQLFGVPKIITLLPLSLLRINGTKPVVQELDADQAQRIQDVAQKFIDLKAQVSELYNFKGVMGDVGKYTKPEVDSVKETLDVFEGKFKRLMVTTLTDLYAGNISNADVAKTLDVVEKMPWTATLAKWLEVKRCEYTSLHAFLDQLKSSAHLTFEFEQINELKLEHGVDYVVVFSLGKLLTGQTAVVDIIKNATGSTAIPTWCGNDAAQLAFLQRFHQELDTFQSFASVNSGTVQTRFAVTHEPALPSQFRNNTEARWFMYDRQGWRVYEMPKPSPPPDRIWRHHEDMVFSVPLATADEIARVRFFYKRRDVSEAFQPINIGYDQRSKTFRTRQLDHRTAYVFMTYFIIPEGRTLFSESTH